MKILNSIKNLKGCNFIFAVSFLIVMLIVFSINIGIVALLWNQSEVLGRISAIGTLLLWALWSTSCYFCFKDSDCYYEEMSR